MGMNNESKTVVILFRHGLAGDRLQFKKTHNKPDELRPLTKEGKFEVRTMAKVLSKMYGNIDSIYFSPYKRTKQTARILNKTIAAKKNE